VSSDQAPLTGPDLERGVPLSDIADGGMLAGHAFGKAILLVRQGDDVFAIGAACAHYSAPLSEGIVVGDTVRCPWHHACFSARTGEALRPPALNPLPRWEVRREGDRVRVHREAPAAPAAGGAPRAREPRSILIIGAGAAGDVAADTLRRGGYDGSITLIGDDADAPYDRPNISKDYLAGSAPEEWIATFACCWDAARGGSTAPATRCVSMTEARIGTTRCCWRPEPVRCDSLPRSTRA
jgi:nitrite reductase/ring-hydroxylating ferredoxin subunit